MSDLISRQAAIDAVETIGFDFSDSDLSEVELEEVCEAIGEVRQTWLQRIKRLLPVEPEKCGDCISREAVKKILDNGWKSGVYPSAGSIDALPSVEPERKKGKWLPHMLTAKCESIDRDVCSECRTCFYGEPTWSWKYCPKCGKPMEVGG